MVVIDAHSHFTPRAVIEALQRAPGSFPHIGLKDLGEGRFAFDFPEIPTTRPMQPRLWDIGAAHDWLDQNGIDVHVVGPWADIFGYTLPTDEGASWAKLVNEATLQALEGQKRFIPLAVVPLQSGEDAAKALEEAHGMGYRGLTIGTFA